MMKKFVTSMLFISLLLMNVIAMAHSPLEKNVVDILKSDTSTIQYRMISVPKNAYEPAKQLLKEQAMIITLAKNGNDKITFMDQYVKGKLSSSGFSLEQNGIAYGAAAVGKKVYSEDGLLAECASKQKIVNSGYDASRSWIDYYFAPFMPEENIVVVNGQEVTKNICNVYHGEGQEIIDGKQLQFIEYRAAENSGIDAVTRYYFENGQIKKCINITKGIKMYFNGEESITDQYIIIDILQIGKEVNPNWFVLPKDIKLMKLNLPDMEDNSGENEDGESEIY